MNDWNKQVITEFRASHGKVAQFGDAPVVILHTIGAKSGELRETPLVALVQPDAMYIFASKAGAPNHPDWHYNLLANPEIDVEFGDEKFRARLTQLPADEAATTLAAQAALIPAFGEYAVNAAPRQIPVYRITRL